MNEEFNDIMNHLSENARFVLQKADFFSKQYNKGYMGTEHLLLGILEQDTCSAAQLLHEEGITFEDIDKMMNKNSSVDPKTGGAMAMMSLSEATVLTLRMASTFAREQGSDTIGTEHILLALISQPNSRATKLLEAKKLI